MRQVGVLAAAGLIALEETPKRLFDDHCNAKFLAEGLAHIPGIRIDPQKVATNIVVFDVAGTGHSGPEISRRLKQRGVLLNAINDRLMRAVTHYDVDRAACEQALASVGQVVQPAGGCPTAPPDARASPVQAPPPRRDKPENS